MAKCFRLVPILVLVFSFWHGLGDSARPLAQYLKTSYDKITRPGEHSGYPVNISADIYVSAFGNIQEADMEFSTFIFLRQEWIDERLTNNVTKPTSLNRASIELLWTPDTYCANARQSDLMLPDNKVHSSVKLYPNGKIFYSRESSVVANCEMDLRDFPFDRQTCRLFFESYSYSTDDIRYTWLRNRPGVNDELMAQFYLVNYSVDSSNVEYPPAGTYSRFRINFTFQRRLGYYIIQVYLPCFGIVAMSWIVFWLKQENTGDRLTVGITAVLTIIFLLGFINQSMPRVSYAKAVDWYLMVSFFFLILTLVECIAVYRLHEKYKEAQEEKREKNSKDEQENILKGYLRFRGQSVSSLETQADEEYRKLEHLSNIFNTDASPAPKTKPKKERDFLKEAKAVDTFCKIGFPLVFTLFNVGYVMWYYLPIASIGE